MKSISISSEKKNTFLTFLSYFIPIAIILLILYLNYLPFGFSDERTIDVGSKDDTKGVFFLEENQNLGARQTTNRQTFRFVDGVVYAVYKPRVVLKDADIEVRIEGENVYFPTPPSLDFLWDYDWKGDNFTDFEIIAPASTYEQFLEGEKREERDFEGVNYAVLFEWMAQEEVILAQGDILLTQDSKSIVLKIENQEIVYELPDYFLENEHTALLGFANDSAYFFVNGEFIEKKELENEKSFEVFNAVYIQNTKEGIKERIELKDGCIYFDGHTRLVLPESQDLFEEGPFAIYVEWIPEKKEDFQQIIGHQNWEIYQNNDNISFQIGRTTKTESYYSTKYLVDEDFFGQKHSLLALYNPSINGDGYIKIFVNSEFAAKIDIEDEEIKTQDAGLDLSLGWSRHSYGQLPHFAGSICNAKFSYKELQPQKQNSITFKTKEHSEEIKIPFWGYGDLKTVKINIEK